MHNNCQPVHLLLAQSHLSSTFHADSTSHPDHFRCDSFLRFSHFPATLFRWDNNPALCGSRFLPFDPPCGSHPILPFEASDGPCGPRFLPARGETIRPERRPHHEERHLDEAEVTPGSTPPDHHSSSTTFQRPQTENCQMDSNCRFAMIDGLHKIHFCIFTSLALKEIIVDGRPHNV